MPGTYPEDSLLVGEGKNIFVTISFGGDLNDKICRHARKFTTEDEQTDSALH